MVSLLDCGAKPPEEEPFCNNNLCRKAKVADEEKEFLFGGFPAWGPVVQLVEEGLKLFWGKTDFLGNRMEFQADKG